MMSCESMALLADTYRSGLGLYLEYHELWFFAFNCTSVS